MLNQNNESGDPPRDGGADRIPISDTKQGHEPSRTRVLIVDDSSQNLDVLARCLQRLGYEVATAARGQLALKTIEEDAPDIVLLDILMPDMSGLDVLRQLRCRNNTYDLPVILISGLGETSDIVEGLRLGANDYVTKPINLPILQARLGTQKELKRARDELKHTANLLAKENDRTQIDLRTAGQVQRSILPQEPPRSETLDTAWCYEPTTEVGGDLFDVAPLPDGRTFLFLADAMGHGIQAALVVSAVKAALMAHRDGGHDLPLLLHRLDMELGGLFMDRFITAAACVVDPRKRRLHYAIAGHPPVLILRRDGVQRLRAGGPPLGMGVGWGFQGGELELDADSAILMYTDGFTEAIDSEGNQFGVDSLIHEFARHTEAHPDTIIQSLRDRLDSHRGPVALEDDLTILVARLR